MLPGGEDRCSTAATRSYDSNGNPQTTLLTSLQQYQRYLMLQQAGFTYADPDAGRRPAHVLGAGRHPYISMVRYDAAPFVQDDWKVRPNFTLSLGLRYEVQNLVTTTATWRRASGSPGRRATARTARRRPSFAAASGIFYDRVGLGALRERLPQQRRRSCSIRSTIRLSIPNIPRLSSLSLGKNTIDQVDPKLRADYSIQSAIGVERQLPQNTTAVADLHRQSRRITYSRPCRSIRPCPAVSIH